MTLVDWMIICAYLTAMVAMSVVLGRGQRDERDYYVGGRDITWWAVAVSTMATQTSAISFLSIPAFVALKPHGGLIWLQYELAVPVAMILIMVFLVPFFRQLELVSVYEYLELRFGMGVRRLISGVFLVSRSLASGVAVYASAILLTVILAIPLWMTILIIGLVAVVYDVIGGMKAVVYSDVVQMAMLVTGVLVCIGYAVDAVGGLGPAVQSFPTERWAAIDFSIGIADGSSAPFWGFLVGGLFLYMAYYGTDQSQVQREFSTRSLDDTRKSLLFNGFARFPLTLLYVFMGLALGAVYARNPDIRAAVPAGKVDYLVPVFIVQTLPVGIRAIIVAAILAATMSSLDSALNSLSAATMRDFIEPKRQQWQLSTSRILLLSRLMTLAWGVFITGFAFLVGNISDTVIESINKIGSAFYGPVLAAFLVGVLSKRVTAAGIMTGVIAGVSINLLLWIEYPQIFWMWWNVSGLIVAVVTAYIFSFTSPPNPSQVARYTLAGSGFYTVTRRWIAGYVWLAVYFCLLFGFLLAVEHVNDQVSGGKPMMTNRAGGAILNSNWLLL